jgi:hypothetical protein
MRPETFLFFTTDIRKGNEIPFHHFDERFSLTS